MINLHTTTSHQPAAIAATGDTAMTSPAITAAIAAELARLDALPRTEFVGRCLSLDITPDAVTVDDQHPDVDGVSMDIWNGTTRSIALRDSLTPAACAEFIRENSDFIARVMAGLDSNWDGSNLVGTLTDDAAAAERELNQAAEALRLDMYAWERGDVLEEMDADEYLRDVNSDIQMLGSADEAEAFAVEGLAPDGVADYGDGLVYVDRAALAALAREWWAEAQDTE